MGLIVITTNIIIYICESIFVFEDYYRKKTLVTFALYSQILPSS